MKIKNVDMYLDGGTMIIKTDSQTYYFDNEIGTTTPGRLYGGGASHMSPEENAKLEEEIINALKEWDGKYPTGLQAIEQIKEMKNKSE